MVVVLGASSLLGGAVGAVVRYDQVRRTTRTIEQGAKHVQTLGWAKPCCPFGADALRAIRPTLNTHRDLSAIQAKDDESITMVNLHEYDSY